MGGKNSTSTQSIQVPPDVLARYNAVNAQAQQTASQPFQVYSTSPSAFVAPMTQAQNEGVWQTESAAQQAQPYYSQAVGTLLGAQGAGLTPINNALGDIDAAKKYGNPYIGNAAAQLEGAVNSGAALNNQSLGTLSGATAASAPLLGAAQSDYTNAYGSAQPYTAGATNYALAGGQPVNPGALNIGAYLSPYLSTVLGSTSALINQNNQQQMQGALGDAIRQGAFGGDRAGLAAANLAQQQNLAAGQIYSGILNQGFNTALGAAQQQQGVGLEAAQANRAALQQTSAALQGLGQQDYTQGMGLGQARQGLAAQYYGQGAQTAAQQAALAQQEYGQGLSTSQQSLAISNQIYDQGLAGAQLRAQLGQDIYNLGQNAATTLGGLGAGAQTASLQGAQALLGAGAAQQQTQQAGLTALYNQFLQQQSYPFQVSQFLANIAEGTGALSGSTTTTTQPGGLFSDRRLKEGVEPIGETFDGQKIVKFRYKGDPTTRIGLIAQDVEKNHPDAVGLAGGYRTVDYDEATRDAARRGHFNAGGLAAANDNREHFYEGGLATGTYGPDYAALLDAQAKMYAPFQAGGLYGSSPNAAPMGGTSYVPAANLPVAKLAVASGGLQPPRSPLQQASDVANLATGIEKGLDSKTGQKVLSSLGIGKRKETIGVGANTDPIDPESLYARGGLARGAHAMGGAPYEKQVGLGLDIPDEAPEQRTLPTPDTPGKPHSALGDIADVAKTAAELAKFIPGLAGGGAADGEPMPDFEGDDAEDQAQVLGLARRLLAESGADEENDVTAPPGVSAPSVAIAAPEPMPSKVEPGEKLSGLPSDLSHTLKLIAKAEGTGKNPKSSAKGLYQITDPTFVGAFRQMFPQKARNMSKADILALRDTPEGDDLSAKMGPWLAHQNIEHLKDAGLQVTPANIYLAHFLGPSGATKVLRADPDTPLDRLVSPQAIAENGSVMRGKTAGDLQSWAFNRLQQMNRATYRFGGRARKAGGGELDEAPSAQDFTTPSDAEIPAPQAASAQASQPAEHHGFWDSLKKPEVFIPILSGLAAMATAPTQHFGTALAAGVGAGAQAYQKQREFALEQLQKHAQAGLMGSEAAALGLKPTELAIRQYEASTGRMQAQMQAFSQAQQAFDANYQQIGTPGPDGFPMWMNRLTGQRLTQSQYSEARNRYLQTALSGIGQGQGLGPLGAVGTLTEGANGSVPGVPGPGIGGADAGGMGAGAPGAGAVGTVPGNVGAGSAPVVPAVPHGAERQTRPAVGGSLQDKLQSGAYLTPAVPLPQVDNSQIADNSNPAILMQQGRALQQNGVSPEIRAQGEQMIERAQRIMSGTEIPLGKDGQPYMGYVRMSQARGAADKVTQSYAGQIEQQNQGAQTFAEQYPQNMQILNSLRRIYSETETNRLSGDFADLIGKVRSIPWLKDKLSPQLKAYDDAVGEAQKDTARQQIVAAVAADMANKAPAAALHVTGMTVPNPSMGAGARYNLVSQLYAQQQLAKDFYRDWNANKSKVMDVASYVNDWTAEHPISAYEKWAYDHIAPFPGMTREEMMQHPRHPKTPDDLKGLRPGLPFVIPTGPNAGKIGWTQ